MKTLFINRHAKSSWKDLNQRDFDRPLNARGKKDAPKMAFRLFTREKALDYVLSSPAKRAHQTAFHFAHIFDREISFDENIYEANYSTLLEIVNNLSDEFNSVILFGHNPGFSDLASYLADENIEMPTCGIAKINFEVDSWSMISLGLGELEYFDYPKNEEKI